MRHKDPWPIGSAIHKSKTERLVLCPTHARVVLQIRAHAAKNNCTGPAQVNCKID